MTKDTIHFELDRLNTRLDIMLSNMITDTSRAQIQEWIKKGLVKNRETGEILKGSYKLKTPIQVTIERPRLIPFEPPKPEARSKDLNIIFEDEHLLVVNKPVGIAVHPGAGRHSGTLVNLLLGHTNGNLSDAEDRERPGIVHRLDKDTSGLMVVAKTNPVHAALANAIQNREMKRIYWALVYNIPQPRAETIQTQFGRDPKSRQRMAVLAENGKTAITHYETVKTFGLDFALIECRLETGRTHQIRVHMAFIHCPVIGDPTYAGRHERRKRAIPTKVQQAIAAMPGQALHARELLFTHPVTGEELHFTAEPPANFQELLNALS